MKIPFISTKNLIISSRNVLYFVFLHYNFPHPALGTFVLFHPSAVAHGLKAVVPHVHEAVLVDVALLIVRADAHAARNVAIGEYFKAIEGKPWVDNTIFVFTADHCGVSHREDYNNEMGRFLIPIFFYTPGGQLPVKCDSTRLIQQTDITPSLLGLLNYPKPFFSFGKDVFSTDSTFEYKKDFSLKNNLLVKKDQFPQLPFMQRQMEAIIQLYVTRMKGNKLTY